MNILSTFAFGLLLLMVSSCGPSIDQQRQQLFAPAIKIMADSDAKLKEDLRHFKEQDEAFLTKVEKFKQKRSIFMASLSDKELLAFSDLNKAKSEEDGALMNLTSRKLVSLLTDSGKIGAYMTMCREGDELLAQAKVLDKRQEELKKQVAQSEKFWTGLQKLDRDWEERNQHRELIDALRGIDRSIRYKSQNLWFP